MVYNIREHVPGHGTGQNVPQPIVTLYNKINTMCYVLGGDRDSGLNPWPYKNVYGSMAATIAQMMKFTDPARSAPPHLGDVAHYQSSWHRLLQQLAGMVAAVDQRIAQGDHPQELLDFAKANQVDISSITNLTLRMLYEIHFTTDKDMLAINAKWKEILAVKEAFLCLPWVYIQQQGKVVPRDEMDKHLSLIADDNLVDLYNTKRNDKQYEPNGRRREAIVHGRAFNILASPKVAAGGPQPQVGGGGDSNEKECVGGHCVDVQKQSFCNEVDGSCSTMSG